MTPPDPEASALHIDAYGPPRVRRGGQALRLGSRKSLALVLVLGLDGPQPREQLAALLWPDCDGPSARRNLRRELFRLREHGVALDELGDAAVALRAPAGDRLDPAPADGDPLPGLDGLAGEAFDAWLQRARTRLHARRAQAWQQAAADAAARGDADTLLALARRQLHADPCDEAAALQAAQALQQLGRPEQARGLARDVTQALRQQLGLPPSPALRALLGVDAEIAAAATSAGAGARAWPATPVLVPHQAPYVERPDERARIEAAWRAGRSVYLSGAAGAGKSRLAQAVASAQGSWLRLRCERDDARVPYASAVRALRTLRDAAPDVELPDWVRRELAQLLPELGPAPAALDADASRARLVAACAAALAALLADNFQALVLDDWHWVDDASLELWAPAAIAGVHVLHVHRSAQLSPAALRRQRAEVDAGTADVVPLDGLDRAQTLALVQALSGSRSGLLFSQRLHGATGGNPFFLLETLRHLQQQGLLQTDPAEGWRTPFDDATTDYAELPVPPTVRDAVLGRARALGEAPMRLLEAASLLSGRFDLAELRDTAALDEDGQLAALSHAAAAQLVVEEPQGWRFAHDLVPQCLAAGIGPSRRRALHRRLAAALQRTRAAPARVAAHLEAAGDGPAAATAYVAAADAALAVHALDAALAHGDAALRCGLDGAAAVALHLARATLHQRRGDPAAAATSLDAAQRLAPTPRDDGPRPGWLEVQLARADACAADRPLQALAMLDAAAAWQDRAAAVVQSQAWQVRSRVLIFLDRLDEGADAQRRAIELLVHEPLAQARRAGLLYTLARGRLRAGDLGGAAAAVDQAAALLQDLDEPAHLADALTLQAVTLTYSGQPGTARQRLLQARELARRCGHVPAQRAALLNLVKLATDAGDTDDAAALLDEGEALAPGYEHARAEQAFREARFYVQYLRGEHDAARASAARLVDAADRVSGHTERIGARHVVVDLFLLTGDLETARRLIDEAQASTDALASVAGGGHFQVQQAAKRAWLCWAEGRIDDARAAWQAAPAPQRREDALAVAWVGCAIALAQGDAAAARRALDRTPVADDDPTDQQALWLVQALALDRRDGGAAPGLHARAAALADSGRLPAVLAQRLQAALHAA